MAGYTWTPAELVKDTGGDCDADKSWIVPTAREWHIYCVSVVLTSTATVGDRRVAIRILNSDSDVLGEAVAGAVQAASTTWYYTFAPGLADMTSVRDSDHMTTPIPGTWVLKAGQEIRVLDDAAIAADSDDLAVYIQGSWRGHGKSS